MAFYWDGRLRSLGGNVTLKKIESSLYTQIKYMLGPSTYSRKDLANL